MHAVVHKVLRMPGTSRAFGSAWHKYVPVLLAVRGLDGICLHGQALHPQRGLRCFHHGFHVPVERVAQLLKFKGAAPRVLMIARKCCGS